MLARYHRFIVRGGYYSAARLEEIGLVLQVQEQSMAEDGP